MLLALVRRRGAERLSTLRDARQRGDHDKVIRVVHSLKPQLVGLDAEYYTALCARLVAQGAPQNGSWNADLDALERGMGQLLAAH
jgi:HPt (histidine-containing phosphotransfer) domain-containing protein